MFPDLHERNFRATVVAVNRTGGLRAGRSSFATLLLTLLVGIVAGAGLAYFLLEQPEKTPAVRIPKPPSVPDGDELRQAREAVETYIARKVHELNLNPEELKAELGRAGRIVREKSRELGSKVAEGASDVRIIAEIKAKYTLDRELSGWAITVGSKEGHVTLSGKVTTPERIARAVIIALDVDGVVDVVSSLQVEEAN